MRSQRVGAVQVALLLVAHAIDLGNHGKALAFNRSQEAVGAVHDGLHGRAVQDDDVAALGALGHEVLAADETCVVVIGARVGHEVRHVGHLGVKAEHRDAGFLQLVQARDDAVTVNRVDEHRDDALGDQVLDLGNLLLVAVLGIQGDQLVAVGLHNLADRGLEGHEERVGAVHAGVADLVAFRQGGAAHDHDQSQRDNKDLLHSGKTSFYFLLPFRGV